MTTTETTTRLSIFPLAGALLFPRMHLPIHIFEPRYRALVSDAMARDRRIGMIQPKPLLTKGDVEVPQLFDMGCVGKIAHVEAMDDGRSRARGRCSVPDGARARCNDALPPD